MKTANFCRIDPAAHLLVRGTDAFSFLQGQFTNDLRPRQVRPATYGLWLNQKGRVLADSFVLQRGENEFCVVSLTSPAAVIRERLEAYIIADDVTVEDQTGTMAGWILAGEGAGALLGSWGVEAPGPGAFAEQTGVTVFRARATAGDNWFLCVEQSDVATWIGKFAALVADGKAVAVSPSELAAGRIAAGVPEIPTELGPADLPNEGGLEHDALSFTKGCYLGQEVMARLHNLGQVRRRLFVVSLASETPVPAPGGELFAGEKRVGELRRGVAHGSRQVGLAMLHTTYAKAGDSLAFARGAAPVVAVERMAEGRSP